MSKLYFTKKGADRITRQKLELMDKLKATQAQKGEAAIVGGNQWHDNFSFEQLTRDEDMINKQIAQVNEKIGRMVVLDEAPKDTDKLRIGHLVVLDVEGETREYVVGGFEDSEPNEVPPVISYLAPLVSKLIGKEVGESVVVELGGRRKTVEIQEIRML